MELDLMKGIYYCNNRFDAFECFKFVSALEDGKPQQIDLRQQLKDLILGQKTASNIKILVDGMEYTKADFEADRSADFDFKIEERNRQYLEMRNRSKSYLEFHRWLKANGYSYNKGVVDGEEAIF